LQYAFYVKSNKIYKTKLNNKIKELSSIKEKLKTSLKKINIKEETALKNIETIKSRLNSLKLNIKKLQIEKERLLVLNKKAQLANIIKIIGNKNKNLQKITKELLKNYFLLFSSALKTGSRKKTFKIEKIITELLQKGKFNSTVTKNVSSLLKDMEKEYLGQLGTLVGSTQRGLSYIFKEIWDKLTYPLFNINKTPISILKIIIAIILIIVGFVSGSFYKKTIKTIAPKSKTLTDSTRTIIANLGYYNIILIVFLITLNVLGINLSSIAIIAGALSFGVGFGLQNIVSNFVSGIILMFERSIKIGDYIELGDELTGHVTDIRMRSTTITTNRNIDVIVPNQDLIQNKVINWTMNDRICRFEIPFGVKYGTSPEKVKEVILKAVNESGYTDIYFSRKPNVIMTEMGDSSVNFKLLVWIRGKNIFAPQITRSKYLMLIYNTLYENNIEIPYPQNDLHIRSIDEKVSFKITSE
jgi:small-conductance mechanosensitive channel